MATRIGVDVGGTFTDLVAYDEQSGEIRIAKGPTTPGAEEIGVRRVIDAGLPPEVVRSAELFLHGSTVGLNALLERKGATVGLIATRGFRDVLEIGRAERLSPYEVTWRPPPPLVPRRLRWPVKERVTAAGRVVVELDSNDVRSAANAFEEARVGSIAVALINAYANPQHEVAVERILRNAGFVGDVSLSHRVSGEYREYERTSTAVIDAYIRPAVSGYLRRLARNLREMEFSGREYVTRSGGGSLSFRQACDRPFETIMSGPAAGVTAAARLAERYGLSRTLTADVGGTSTDIALILDGRPGSHDQVMIGDMPVQAQWVDVRAIGAGGGSIALAETAGLLRVGPQSAGSHPGPACYGRGGTDATVTDAAVYLGFLGAAGSGGSLRLDVGKAEVAIGGVARRLAITKERAAAGIIEVATVQIANALRKMSLEQGEDARTATLIAYGGMGPLFGSLIARELAMVAVLVPEHAGNFSALGLLEQDVIQSASRTLIGSLTVASMETVGRAVGSIAKTLDADPGSRCEAGVDLRVVGQRSSLTIPIGWPEHAGPDAPTQIAGRFREAYLQIYGQEPRGAIEIAGVRATVTTPLPRLPARRVAHAQDEPSAIDTLRAFSFSLGDRATFSVRDRKAVFPTQRFPGPMLIREQTATTYVDAGSVAEVDDDGNLWVRVAEEVR